MFFLIGRCKLSAKREFRLNYIHDIDIQLKINEILFIDFYKFTWLYRESNNGLRGRKLIGLLGLN
jgi:hypothetical protein